MLKDHILFLDGEALVLDKPAGLPVDPPRDGSISLENHLESLKLGFQRWPTAVHRLDRDTSGCLLLARNPKAHARFQQAFEQGLVGKRYLAVLEGVPEGEEGMIDLALIKTSTQAEGWRMRGDPAGKAARTAWKLIRSEGARSLVEFRPETGRTHQIRVHAAEGLGAAVVGDPVYGRADPLGMMLHAAELTVPRGAKPPVEAKAPLPERFEKAGFGGWLTSRNRRSRRSFSPRPGRADRTSTRSRPRANCGSMRTSWASIPRRGCGCGCWRGAG